MADFIKGLKVNYSVSALVCILAGLVLLIWPGTTTQIVCMLMGSILLVYGLVQVAAYLRLRERTIISQGMLLLGIVFSVIGLWILFSPEMILMAIPVIVGILIIIHGIHNVSQALELHREGYGRWWVALVFGILTVCFGGVLVRNPFGAVEMVVRMIGISLIYDGASDMWIISRVFKVRKDKEKIIDAVFVDIKDE